MILLPEAAAALRAFVTVRDIVAGDETTLTRWYDVRALFESAYMKNMILANRFVRSATWEGLATVDGFVTERLVEAHAQLAHGGVGLIITGHAYVSREGQASGWQLGVYSDSLTPGLGDLADAVHAAGGKIVMQLGHAGSRGLSDVIGLERMGPSVMETDSGPVGREMTLGDIETVTRSYARAAARAQTAGFDGVQIHAAHGYLLSQFLSPFFNKRKDDYGDSVENRARFLIQVFDVVKGAVGPDFPISAKINSEDFLPGGFTVEDMIRVSVMLEEAGIDTIEMSGGTFISGRNTPFRAGKPDPGEPEAYYEAAARQYKKAVRVPLILVGGIRTLETSERLISEGTADYVALCRPLIREPDLVNRWKSGDRRPASCVSCSGCFGPGREGKGISCVVEEREQRRNEGKSSSE